MRNDNELDRGFAALREEISPTGAQERALMKLRHPSRNRSWRVASVPIAALLVGAAFFALPRPSAAAELKEIVQALKKADRWLAEVYVKNPDGSDACSMLVASDGRIHKTTFVGKRPDGSETAVAFADGLRINFFPKYTLIDKGDRTHRPSPEDILSDMDQSGLVKNVHLERNVRDRGRLLDRYVLTWDQVATGGRNGTLAVYTEPGTKRPVRILGLTGNSVGLHSEWRYEKIPNELLDITIPNDRPCYDLPKQRADFEALLLKTSVNKGIAMVGAWSDVSGHLLVMTTGDAGLPGANTRPIEVAGMPQGENSLIPWNAATPVGEQGWITPTRAFGHATVAHVTRFERQVSGPIELLLPVWKSRLKMEILRVNVSVTPTFSVTTLFTPMNLPYFQSSTEVGKTTRG